MYDQYLTMGGVPPKHIDKCMAWAFGSDWMVKEMIDCAEYWNKHHNLFKIDMNEPVGQTLTRIAQEYMRYEYKQEDVRKGGG